MLFAAIRWRKQGNLSDLHACESFHEMRDTLDISWGSRTKPPAPSLA